MAGLMGLAADLAKQSITIEANANDEGHLYGSVNAVDVSNALKRTGFHIATDQVRLEGPLKSWACTPSKSTSAPASTPK